MAYLLTGLVFGLSLLHKPLASAGWQWDSANALGFLAFAGMLYLFIDVGAGRRNRVHQWLSYATAASLLGHVAWFVSTDPTVWHYLAWDAPWYMLTGLAAFFCIAGVMILALPPWRRWWGQNRSAFRNWHYALSLAGIAAAASHILGAGFYISSGVEIVLYLALCVTVALISRSPRSPDPSTPPLQLLGVMVIAGLFVSIKAVAT